MAVDHDSTPSRDSDFRHRRRQPGNHGRLVSAVLELLDDLRTYWPGCLITFLNSTATAILIAPGPRLAEHIVCKIYLEQHDPSAIPKHGSIPEERCKIPEVQERMTFIMTVIAVLSCLGAVVAQFPIGYIADKKGRYVAMKLNILSSILYIDSIFLAAWFAPAIPLWVMYVAPMFLLIGGGPWATGSLVNAGIHDTTESSERTLAFSILSAVGEVASIVGPILGTLATLNDTLWLPYVLTTICFLLMFFPLQKLNRIALPSGPTAPLEEERVPLHDTDAPPLLNLDGSVNDEEDIPDAPLPAAKLKPALRSKTAIYVMCFGSLFLIYLAYQTMAFIVPWMALRFEVPMTKSGLVFSVGAFGSLLVYLFIIPKTSTYLTDSLHLSSSARDLVIAQVSVALMALSALISAVAPNTFIFLFGHFLGVLGTGVTVSLRAFLAANVETRVAGRLYTAMGACLALASLLGMPLMGGVYAWAIAHGVKAVGVPWLVATGLYALVFCVLTVFQMRGK